MKEGHTRERKSSWRKESKLRSSVKGGGNFTDTFHDIVPII
jgi:hypothetical protein